VSNSAAYQEAWEQYRKTVRQDNNAIDTAEWGTDAPVWSTVEAKIHAILEFVKNLKWRCTLRALGAAQ
jgi:hypothetical protein